MVGICAEEHSDENRCCLSLFQALEAQAALAESKYQSLKREMEVIRERHDGEMHRLELAHSRWDNVLHCQNIMALSKYTGLSRAGQRTRVIGRLSE